MPMLCGQRLSRIGAKITMFGVVSMTQPAMIRMPIIKSLIIIGSSVSEVTA